MAKLYFSVDADYQKVIRLREEIAKLEKQMKGFNSHTTTDAIEKLQDELKDLRTEYNELTRNAAKSGAEIEKSSLTKGKALAAIGGVAALKSLGSEIIRVRGEFQEMETAIETLVGKSMSDKLLPQIKELAKVSPLTMTDIVGAEKMMLGFNIEADKTIGFLKALSDVSMGSSQKFNSLTLAFSQMSASGKLMGQDLNQMINAGFNPLQQIAKITGKSIATLKEEMSKGAVSAEMVQQAFIDATSAGGKFYKMSENASKTINGQISMMEDAWDAALNEIGQNSEGLIMSGIQATTTLIQNYETVGKVLVALVSTYGVYKAALIANIALEKAQAIQRLASIKGVTSMKLATDMLSASLTKLNAKLMDNPYAILAGVVVSLGVAIYQSATKMTYAEMAVKKYNDAINEQKELEEKRKTALEELLSVLSDESASSYAKIQAMNRIRDEYPALIQKYIDEKGHVKDLVGLWKEYNEEIEKNRKESNLQRLSEANAELEKRKANLDNASNMTNAERREAANNAYKAAQEAQKVAQKAVDEDNFIEWQKNLKKRTDAQIDAELLELKRIESARKNNKNMRMNSVGVGGYKGIITDEELSKSIEVLNSESELRKQSKSNFDKDYQDAKAAWEKAKKELKKIEENRKAYTTKQYEDAKKNVDSTEAAYKKLGGKTEKQLKQEETEAEKKKKEEQKLADELLSIRRKNQQDEIDLLKEGSEKKLKQIELDYQKELDEIEKQKRELRDKQGGKLTNEQHSAFGLALVNAEDKKNKSTAEVLDDEEKAMNDYLRQYGSWMQKREAITKEYTRRINDASTEGEKLTLGKQMEKELAEVDNAAKETTSAIVALFEDMSDKTIVQMREIADEAETIYAYLKTGVWVERKDAEGEGTGQDAYGLTEAQFNTIKDDPEKLKAIADGVKGVRKEADEAEPVLKKMGDAFGKLFSNDKNFEKNLSVIIGGIGQINQAAEFLGDTFSQISDAMGGNFLGGIAEGIGVATEAVNGAMSGAEAGKVFGPWGAAAGAAIGLVGSLTSSLSKLHDKKHERRIVRLQEQIDTLEKTYDKLGEEIEDAYSNDAKGLIEDQNKLLEQQKLLIQNQIKEEEDKKKTDKGRIKEWKEQIEEIDKTIEDNKEKAKDAIFGSDLQSAIEDFASAYAEAWGAGEDKAKSAKDVVKSMIKNMIMESIKAASSDPMKAIREKLLEFWSDEYISGWEQDYLNNMATDLQEQLDKQFGWADGIMGKNSYSQEATSKGFESMSQETGEELNGRFTALQISGEETKNQVTLLNITTNEIKAIQMGVKDIVTGIQDQLANSYLELVAINENTGATAMYLKDIKADIAEVKENTKNL